MKVFQINSFFSVGGPPKIVCGIYEELLNEGHSSILAAGREKPISFMKTIKIGCKISPYINAFLCRIFDNDGFSSKKATQKLIKEIANYKPDIIHIHNLHGYYINISILFDFIKNINVPVVWTLHDCWAITGHCTHFDYEKCYRWKEEGCHNCKLKHAYPSSFIIDNSKKNYNLKKTIFNYPKNITIVTVSEWLKKVVSESFLKNYNIKVIYNGINLKHFYPDKGNFRQKFNLNDKRLILGVAQNWSEKKGLNDFIKLSKILPNNFKIILVGIDKKIKRKVPNGIICLPQIKSFDTLRNIYSSCDICLNLSYEETFGFCTLESIACGTPVVSYDKTAVPEISNLFNVPVVKAGEINSLLKTTIETINSNNIIFDNIYKFEEKVQYKKYLALYNEIMMERDN